MKVFNKIIEFLGNILITVGEVGLTIFGLTYLWSVSKVAFIFALVLVGIIKMIYKIKKRRL